MRLLFIEDEPLLLEQLAAQLTGNGYAVETAATGADGLHLGREYPMDIAIVDLGLPDVSGMEVIRSLRGQGKDFPILVLTARSRWQEKVEALEAGADDYLVKPFQFEELLARLNALLRRSQGWATPVLDFPPVRLDMSARQVSLNRQPVTLTAFEYKVLEYLMLHAGEVISKSVLTEHIYQQDYERDSNVLEVLLSRLRRKLDPDNTIKPIQTLRGSGYRFILEKQG
jgi:two-component system response regulator PhoP